MSHRLSESREIIPRHSLATDGKENLGFFLFGQRQSSVERRAKSDAGFFGPVHGNERLGQMVMDDSSLGSEPGRFLQVGHRFFICICQ